MKIYRLTFQGLLSTTLLQFAACTTDAKNSSTPSLGSSAVVWSGQTLAGAVLRADALQIIRPLAGASKSCQWPIEAVSSELIAIIQKGQTSALEAHNPIVVERWTVRLCNKSEILAVVFIPSSDGGTDVKASLWNSPLNPFSENGKASQPLAPASP